MWNDGLRPEKKDVLYEKSIISKNYMNEFEWIWIHCINFDVILRFESSSHLIDIWYYEKYVTEIPSQHHLNLNVEPWENI